MQFTISIPINELMEDNYVIPSTDNHCTHITIKIFSVAPLQVDGKVFADRIRILAALPLDADAIFIVVHENVKIQDNDIASAQEILAFLKDYPHVNYKYTAHKTYVINSSAGLDASVSSASPPCGRRESISSPIIAGVYPGADPVRNR